jgi:epsilon-lactone hydrolase
MTYKVGKKLNKQISDMSTAQSQSFVDSFESNITSTNLDNVNILGIKPANWTDNGKILVSVHGGVIQF